MARIKLVVIDGHTLCYIEPRVPDTANILHASCLRGSPHPVHGQILVTGKEVRLATEHDFESYRVDFNGYKTHPEEYEFA